MSQEEKKNAAQEPETAEVKTEAKTEAEAPAPEKAPKHEKKRHETAALEAKLDAAEKKADDLKTQLLRTAAEYDNYR